MPERNDETTIPASFGGFEEEFLWDLRFGRSLTVPAAGMAGLGALAQGIVNDGLDGARASAAFDAAAKAVIDPLGATRQIRGGVADGIADVMVAEDVAGTYNHGNASALR
jgi:hypothetical protein